MLELTRFEYCPRCGVAGIETFEGKAMHCTACGYVYYHNTCSANAAIIETDGGILLTLRGNEPHRGAYDLPGGFVDYDESVETALLREVKEELGIEVEINSYIGSFPNRYEYRGVIYHTADAFFICRYDGATEKITCSKELLRWEIVPPDRLPLDRFAFPSIVKALTLYAGRGDLSANS